MQYIAIFSQYFLRERCRKKIGKSLVFYQIGGGVWSQNMARVAQSCKNLPKDAKVVRRGFGLLELIARCYPFNLLWFACANMPCPHFTFPFVIIVGPIGIQPYYGFFPSSEHCNPHIISPERGQPQGSSGDDQDNDEDAQNDKYKDKDKVYSYI